MDNSWDAEHRMSDEQAARIICAVFPRRIFGRSVSESMMQLSHLIDALWVARLKCGNNGLGECVKWARKLVRKSKRNML